jgi:hypothetical protein
MFAILKKYFKNFLKKEKHTMKKNKLINVLTSFSAMGTIGTGTAIGMTSCSNTQPGPVVDYVTIG